ncbi:MAG: histone deacetylase family protein [Roseovarius sp.]|nr:histone deacetylase family protein [Roseovarius sp.]
MGTALITHSDYLDHVNPPGHPERVARLERLLPALDGRDLLVTQAREAKDGDLLLCHGESYVDMIRSSVPKDGWTRLDGDTSLSPGSLDAALKAAGGAIQAADMVIEGLAENAFVACRPPGHHAERETAMGFCIFGNVAIAARHLMERRGVERVAAVDFDVHHGNGTQDILWSESRSLFVSSHQMPLWPGSGAADETGEHGNILNLPLRPGSGGKEFRESYERMALPALERFEPEFLLISAGFDAHANDPLANLELVEDDYIWITEKLCDLASRYCKGRMVSCLEGGYDLDSLTSSASAHVDVLVAHAA